MRLIVNLVQQEHCEQQHGERCAARIAAPAARPADPRTGKASVDFGQIGDSKDYWDGENRSPLMGAPAAGGGAERLNPGRWPLAP